jgi:hypothetical protein
MRERIENLNVEHRELCIELTEVETAVFATEERRM